MTKYISRIAQKTVLSTKKKEMSNESNTNEMNDSLAYKIQVLCHVRVQEELDQISRRHDEFRHNVHVVIACTSESIGSLLAILVLCKKLLEVERGRCPSIVIVAVHVQHLLSRHGEKSAQDAFLEAWRRFFFQKKANESSTNKPPCFSLAIPQAVKRPRLSIEEPPEIGERMWKKREKGSEAFSDYLPVPSTITSYSSSI